MSSHDHVFAGILSSEARIGKKSTSANSRDGHEIRLKLRLVVQKLGLATEMLLYACLFWGVARCGHWALSGFDALVQLVQVGLRLRCVPALSFVPSFSLCIANASASALCILDTPKVDCTDANRSVLRASHEITRFISYCAGSS